MIDVILYVLAGFIIGFWTAELIWLRSTLRRFGRRYDAGERDTGDRDD